MASTLITTLILATFATSAPPTPLTGAARDAAFPPGDPATAAAYNKKGLDARKAGDHKGALALYGEAVIASESYAPAIYNFACELAVLGNPSGALDALSLLVQLGTAESLRYAASARFDADFTSVRNDARFIELQSIFNLDPRRPTIAQLCENPGKVASLVDNSVGVVHFFYNFDRADETPGKTWTKVVKDGAARAAVQSVMRMGDMCNEGKVADDAWTLPDRPLGTSPVPGLTCFHHDSPMEYAPETELCFGVRNQRWMIVLAAEYDRENNPDEPQYYAPVRKKVAEAKAKALSLIAK